MEEEPAMVYKVTCACGFEARGSEEELIPIVQQHGREVHGMDVTPEQVMAQATPDEG